MTKSNVLIQGEVGTGKTRCLMTALSEYTDEQGEVKRGAGQAVFLLSLEPGAESTLGLNTCRHLGSSGIHLHYIQPLALSWSQFTKYMTTINSMSLDKALEVGDPNKRQCTQMIELLNACGEFTCDICGTNFGDAGEWDDTRTLALDGMTGLTTVARHLCVGLKPILSRPEYNPVMGAIEGFLQLFWGGTKCNAVLLAHVDREVNPVTGISGITMSTIGQKLAPRIAKMPDEIITSDRDDSGRFVWRTEVTGTITKVRKLPRANLLQPDFTQLFK